ncbi:hypothetical protein ISR94_01340 [Candidatus Microgenomates bacterium]|nr:hypothetical protein [Candidatus Microgenomates bacterium]
MKKNNKKDKPIYVLLFIIFIFAFVLRIWFLKFDSLSFYYDQARDFLVVKQILSGNIKIQGPPSSTPGLFHGVFYYYLLAPISFLAKGSPIAIGYWIAFLNSLAVFIVFAIANTAFKKPWLGVLSALLFAVSFESTQYATWVSNPTIAIWTVPLLYLGLWLWFTPRSSKSEVWVGPVLTAIGFGLSVQAEIFLLYHAIPILIWLYIHKKNISKKQIITFLAVLTASVFSLILCEFKFGFGSISAFKSLATTSGGNLAYTKSVGDYLVLYLNQIGRVFALNTFPGNIGIGGALIIVLGVYSLLNFKKDKYPAFLAIWLFSHITVVSVGGISTPFLMVGIGPAVSLILAFYIYKLYVNKSKFLAILFILIMVYGNLFFVFSQNKSGSTLFAIQKSMIISKQKAAIDYTYEITDGEPFSINTLTSPLWINIVWTYLYNWYGMNQYGYVPLWHGKDQVGQLDSLERVETPLKQSFLILEPMAGIPAMYLPIAIGEEDVDTMLLEEKSFGEIVVQSRTLLK